MEQKNSLNQFIGELLTNKDYLECRFSKKRVSSLIEIPKEIYNNYNNSNNDIEKTKYLEKFKKKFEANFNNVLYGFHEWEYVAYKDYTKCFEDKKEWFFIEYPDATINDFYAEEIKEIEKNTISETNPNIYFVGFCLNEVLEPDFLKKVNYSQLRKLEYVKALQGNKTEIEEYIPPKLTIKHKITLLHELGIIEHIRNRQKFGLSTNQIAKVIALLLNEKETTIQSDLSALENNDKDKTPLKNKNIQKIHDYLINIGFSNDSFETKTPL